MEEGAKFCMHCGTPVPEDAIGQNQNHQQTYQPQTGCQPGAGGVPPYQQMPYGQNDYHAATYQSAQTFPVTELSKKVRTEAIIWFCIAGYQIILGFVNLMIGDYALAPGLLLFFIAGLNIFGASKDLQYSKDVLVKPVGIVAKYKPVTGLIVTLVYNLCFGGILGVIGAVFSFMTREYVLRNEASFLNIEAQADRRLFG